VWPTVLVPVLMNAMPLCDVVAAAAACRRAGAAGAASLGAAQVGAVAAAAAIALVPVVGPVMPFDVASFSEGLRVKEVLSGVR